MILPFYLHINSRNGEPLTVVYLVWVCMPFYCRFIKTNLVNASCNGCCRFSLLFIRINDIRSIYSDAVMLCCCHRLFLAGTSVIVLKTNLIYPIVFYFNRSIAKYLRAHKHLHTYVDSLLLQTFGSLDLFRYLLCMLCRWTCNPSKGNEIYEEIFYLFRFVLLYPRTTSVVKDFILPDSRTQSMNPSECEKTCLNIVKCSAMLATLIQSR